jgi:hypothetical protein
MKFKADKGTMPQQRKLNALDALKKSLFHQAFTGEL